jgi:hypothetical protein
MIFKQQITEVGEELRNHLDPAEGILVSSEDQMLTKAPPY